MKIKVIGDQYCIKSFKITLRFKKSIIMLIIVLFNILFFVDFECLGILIGIKLFKRDSIALKTNT